MLTSTVRLVRGRVGSDGTAHEVDRVSLDLGNQGGVALPVHPFGEGEIHNLEWITAPQEYVSAQLYRRDAATVRPQRGWRASEQS
jgi:hypothetical protein